MSRTCFRVNLHSIVAWMSRNSLLKTGAISEVYVTATWIEPTIAYFVNEHTKKWRWVRFPLQSPKLWCKRFSLFCNNFVYMMFRIEDLDLPTSSIAQFKKLYLFWSPLMENNALDTWPLHARKTTVCLKYLNGYIILSNSCEFCLANL